MHIAIVGAGLAGLCCAKGLQEQGYCVTLYEKSRGTGGRMATRRTELGGFDHGAQYFTATSERFKKQVTAWRKAGWVAPWDAKIVTLDHGITRPAGRSQQRLVGVPGMRSLSEQLAIGLDIRYEQQVLDIEAYGKQWVLSVKSDTVAIPATAGPFDAVLIAVPADQAQGLLTVAPKFAQQAKAASMAPCWTLMMAFQEPLELGYDAAWVQNARLGWISRDSSKPGRRAGDHWVAHATVDWSIEHLEDEPERAKEKLLKSFHESTGSAVQPIYATVHRWRYAQALKPLGLDCLWDAGQRIGVCGDWFAAGLDGAGRIENAYLSAQALVKKITP